MENCPRCGGVPEITQGPIAMHGTSVACSRCGLGTYIYDDADEAQEAWEVLVIRTR